MSGKDVFFAATGVTDGEMLEGVHYIGPQGATTESISMRVPLGHGAPDHRSPRPGEAARRSCGERLG